MFPALEIFASGPLRQGPFILMFSFKAANKPLQDIDLVRAVCGQLESIVAK
jgi:hypothetical protein